MIKPPQHVLIAGGGVIGLTAALVMRAHRFSVTLIEAEQVIKEANHRVYAISRNSEQFFEKLAVWPLIDQKKLSPYQSMNIWDSASCEAINLHSDLMGEHHLGMIVGENNLKNALYETIKKHDIEIISNCQIKEVHNVKNRIEVCNGTQTYQGELLIITDGAQSMLRQLLHIPMTTWSYHQEAIVATVNTEFAHQNTAFQVFNPDGPLAFLPLADKHTCSIVWSTSTKKVHRLQQLSEEAFNQELAHAFNHKLGACKVLTKRQHFPLIMRQAKQYVGTNWMLMGDAAHTIHPLAGLGLNLGLGDLKTWGDLLTKNKSPYLIKSLSQYQRARKSEVWKIILLIEGIKTFFAQPATPIVQFRGLALKMCNHLNNLKRFFIDQANI